MPVNPYANQAHRKDCGCSTCSTIKAVLSYDWTGKESDFVALIRRLKLEAVA